MSALNKNIFALLGSQDDEPNEEPANSENLDNKYNQHTVIPEPVLPSIVENNPNDFQKSKHTNRGNRFDRVPDEMRTSYRDDKMLENKSLYDETLPNENIGNDLKLNSYWTVWVHRADNPDWTISGYEKIYQINSIGSFWRFFNNLQLLNIYHNQIFIMRGEIVPIWEDVNNKFGGICSLKIDSIQKGMKTDISTEIFTLINLLVINETLVQNNKNINGISYSIKKRSSLIKIWTKTYNANHDFTKDLPVPLINKFNNEIQKQSRSVLRDEGKISILYKKIEPQYEI